MLLEQVKGLEPDAELTAEYDSVYELLNEALDTVNTFLEAGGIPRGAMGGDDDPRSLGNKEAENRIENAATPRGAMGTGDSNMMGSYGPGKVPVGNNMDEILDGLERTSTQLMAAKRGLGLVNKLAPGKSRGEHASRIMGHLNRVRGNITRIMKQMAKLQAESESGGEEMPA